MAKRYEATTAEQRAIERALARLMSRRVARAKAAQAKSQATRKRREREKREAKANRPVAYVPAPEREARAVARMRRNADRYDRSAARWIASAERAEAAGDMEAAEKRRRAAATFARNAASVREMADEREKGIRREMAGDPVEVRARTERKLALPAYKVICARLEPGRWYRMGEIRALCPEYAASTIKHQVMFTLRDRGWVERAENPDFDATIPERAMGTGRYLYRLALKATEMTREWRQELGEG